MPTPLRQRLSSRRHADASRRPRVGDPPRRGVLRQPRAGRPPRRDALGTHRPRVEHHDHRTARTVERAHRSRVDEHEDRPAALRRALKHVDALRGRPQRALARLRLRRAGERRRTVARRSGRRPDRHLLGLRTQTAATRENAFRFEQTAHCPRVSEGSRPHTAVLLQYAMRVGKPIADQPLVDGSSVTVSPARRIGDVSVRHPPAVWDGPDHRSEPLSGNHGHRLAPTSDTPLDLYCATGSSVHRLRTLVWRAGSRNPAGMERASSRDADLAAAIRSCAKHGTVTGGHRPRRRAHEHGVRPHRTRTVRPVLVVRRQDRPRARRDARRAGRRGRHPAETLTRARLELSTSLFDGAHDRLPVRARSDLERLNDPALEHHRRRDRLEPEHGLVGADERDRRIGLRLQRRDQPADQLRVVGKRKGEGRHPSSLYEHTFASSTEAPRCLIRQAPWRARSSRAARRRARARRGRG